MQSALSNPTSIARRLILTLVALACLYPWCGAVALAGVVPSFQGLGALEGGDPEGFRSLARGISADGLVVVGNGASASGGEAFRWMGGVMTGLGDLPGGIFDSLAIDVSANGQFVVGHGTNAAAQVAVRWDGNSIMALDELILDGSSQAWGVSDDGSVVVGEADSALGREAFLWTETGGMIGLGNLTGGTHNSQAKGISADGTVVVGSSLTPIGDEAFRWTAAGGMEGLGFLGTGQHSIARDVSPDGSVIVGSSNTTSSGGTQAFRWENDNMISLGGLAGEAQSSGAWAVSADGSVVVGVAASSAPGGIEAFIWNQTNGMRRVSDILTQDLGLNIDGWVLTQAENISADGKTIIGVGRNPDGFGEAWIATIPEPSTFFLIVVGTCLLHRRRRP